MNRPLVEGIDFYWEGDKFVFTGKYHLDKGYCCGSGCRHCPYDFENVPEPKRSGLLANRSPQDPLPPGEKRKDS